jgi:hypothetical protein
VQDDVHVAEQARGARIVDGTCQDLVLREILAADVDEDGSRLDRMRRDQAALDQQVRVARHDLAVLEGARLRFVGVDDDVLARVLHVDQRRLPSHREAGAAAPAQRRVCNRLHDCGRIHLPCARE